MGEKPTFTTCDMLRVALQEHHTKSESWTDTGRAFGVKAGTACRIAKGDYEPKRSDIRASLGLPVYAPAQVCAIHGVVHTLKRCPSDKPRTVRAKKPKWFSGNYLNAQTD